METRTRVALGLAGGYLLGRFRKARWLLALAAVGSSPEVRKLVHQGRENVVSALSTGVEGLNERIHATTESLRGDSSNGQEPRGEQSEQQNGESEGQGEPDDEGEPESRNGQPKNQDKRQDQEKQKQDEQKNQGESKQDESADGDEVKPPGGAPKRREPRPATVSDEGDEQTDARDADQDDDRERTPSARVSGRPAGVRGGR